MEADTASSGAWSTAPIEANNHHTIRENGNCSTARASLGFPSRKVHRRVARAHAMVRDFSQKHLVSRPPSGIVRESLPWPDRRGGQSLADIAKGTGGLHARPAPPGSANCARLRFDGWPEPPIGRTLNSSSGSSKLRSAQHALRVARGESKLIELSSRRSMQAYAGDCDRRRNC